MSRIQAFHHNAAVFTLASELSEASAHIKKFVNTAMHIKIWESIFLQLPNHSTQFHLLVQY
jgi:hypothetical protein